MSPPTMLDRRQLLGRSLVVGGALALTSATAFAAMPRRAEHRLAHAKLGKLIPTQIGPWRFATSDGVVVPGEEGPVDGYDQVVTRVYEASGLPSVMLLMAYGSTQGGSLQLHRPETCYPGQGFKLTSFSDVDLHPAPDESIAARTFTASRDDRIERLIYWTRIAESFPRSTAQEYRAIIGSVLHGIVPDGILVRLSSVGTNIRASDEALAKFAAAMIDGAAAGRAILVGNSMAAAIARRDATRRI
ncbi:EpsI family protein [Sphingomonas sp. RB3P16]|uniref:exosortase C-terminal domain/associated protein EpsI n=1 Tax=Parasphingomonas frigoris TaxID=3096163 RepID=UPI002FC95681